MGKPNYFLQKVQAEYERKLAEKEAELEAILIEAKHHSRVFQMDLVTIALGRMGWGEKRLKRLDEMLTAVAKEYCEQITEELKEDDEAWKTQADMDRELKQYAGSLFKPFEERYR